MPCFGCTNRGIVHDENSDSDPILNNGFRKLKTTNWLKDYNSDWIKDKLVEIRFKNTRKEYFTNSNNLRITEDDIVAVEAQRGHDVGTVSLTGNLVLNQLKKRNFRTDTVGFGKIYRKATKNDIRLWYESMEKEKPTLFRSRQIIKDLELDMKLSDVEYQADGSKAIFYYIADDRIDYRELIKLLAREFSIRVEMKQIGARQEAARIGGIGSCGRELCCSSWKTNLQSIPINSARIQELPLNMQRLAGQCGKLKCCMMYEMDNYMEARQDIPSILLELETESGTAFHHKTDILKRIMYYSYSVDDIEYLIPVSVERVKEIISLNKKGIKAEDLTQHSTQDKINVEYINEPDSIHRFDQRNSKKSGRRKR